MPKINEHTDKALLSAMALEKAAQTMVSEAKRSIQILKELQRIGHTGKGRVGEAFVLAIAQKTKWSRTTIYLDLRRARVLGHEALKQIQGTSLDHGHELDALTLLGPIQRQKVIDRAVAGEIVSAIVELKGQAR